MTDSKETASVGRGVALILCAIFCFVLLEMQAKLAGALMPVGQVIWARYAVHLVLLVAWFGPRMGRNLMRTRHPRIQLLRSFLLLGTTSMTFLSLQFLQMAEVTALALSVPFFVAALSVPMLGEKVGPHRWTAILLGFMGVLIVVRPGTGLFHPAVLLPVIGAVLLALYMIVTRKIAGDEDPVVSIFFTALAGAVVLTLAIPFVWQAPSAPLGYALMVGVGLAGGFGHYLLILATRHAPASLLAPYYYVQIFWSALAGFVAFGDVPDAYTIAGAGVIICAGLYLWLRERRAAGKAKRAG